MIELKCDKCGKKIDIAMYLESGNVIKRKTCVVSFRFEREIRAENGNGFIPTILPHELNLDICPDCQEQIIKYILGYTPWLEGK